KVDIVAEAGTVADTKALLDKYPDISILLCDINFPDGDGFEVLQYVNDYNKSTKVIFLSMHDKSSYATRAIDAGASGYLTKEVQKEELLTALISVSNGRKYIGQDIMNDIVENIHRPVEDHSFFQKILSKRELEVLELIVAGVDTKEIADRLFISE